MDDIRSEPCWDDGSPICREPAQSGNDVVPASPCAGRGPTRIELLSKIGHEIRTPLAAILGCADALLSEEGLEQAPPHRRAWFETMRRSSQQILRIVRNLMDWSDLASETFDWASEPIELRPRMAAMVEPWRSRAREAGLALVLHLDDRLPHRVRTDAERLEQMVDELIDNAIKFSSSGSRIEVDVTWRDEGRSGHMVIAVRDSGPGMTADVLGCVFEPFMQGDNTATRQKGGLGLGLALVKGMAECVGGRLAVRSRLGDGTCCTLELPMSLPDDGPAAERREPVVDRAAAQEAVASLQGTRILVAEDTPALQRLTQLMLTRRGALVTVVENGKLAVDHCLDARPATGKGRKRVPYDVILMDMQMPVMDGYEATRRLRQEGIETPIIAITAHAAGGDRQRCLDAGCDDYVAKPIDWDVLVRCIGHHLVPARAELPSD